MPAYDLFEEFHRPNPDAPATNADPLLEAFKFAWPAGVELDEAAARLVVLDLKPWLYKGDYAAMDATLAALEWSGWLRRTSGGWQRPELNPTAPESTAPSTVLVYPDGEVVSRTFYVETLEGLRAPIDLWFEIPAYRGPREDYEAFKQHHIDTGTPLTARQLNSIRNRPN